MHKASDLTADSDEHRPVSTGQLDVLLSGQPVWLIAGPINAGEPAAIAASLNRLSAGDPRRRVGLIPTRHSRSWAFDPGSLESASLQAPESMTPAVASAEAMTAALNSILVSSLDIRVPVAVIPDDFAVFRFDHGLGDAHILMKMVAAVSCSGAGSDMVPTGTDIPNVRYPAIWSVLNAARTTPGTFVGAIWAVFQDKVGRLRSRLSKRSRRRDEDPDHVQSTPDPYSAVYVKSSSDYAARMRRYRAAHQVDMSVSALTMYFICRSMCAAGIPIAPEVEVLVDLRRYLPEGLFTWANFTAVSRIEFRSDTPPQEFGEKLATNLASGRPLIEMVGGIAKLRVLSLAMPRHRHGDWVVGERSATGAATVTMSDITRLPAVADVRWRQDARPNLAVALPPASRSHISILICAPSPGEFQLTASFFPAEFDADKIRNALSHALAITDADNPPEGINRESSSASLA
jgi:hypothetical protein